MKKFYKWIIRKFATKAITNAVLKDFIHETNASFAQKVKLGGKEVAAGVAADISKCAAVRLEAFADDGSISPDERARIDANDDAILDKYFSDEQIKALLARIFA